MSKQDSTVEKVKHTKAPWRFLVGEFDDDDSIGRLGSICGADDFFIAELLRNFEVDEGEVAEDGMAPAGTAMANALVMTAAPDMLNACRLISAFAEVFVGKPLCIDGVEIDHSTLNAACDAARAAIAKAEGGAL